VGLGVAAAREGLAGFRACDRVRGSPPAGGRGERRAPAAERRSAGWRGGVARGRRAHLRDRFGRRSVRGPGTHRCRALPGAGGADGAAAARGADVAGRRLGRRRCRGGVVAGWPGSMGSIVARCGWPPTDADPPVAGVGAGRWYRVGAIDRRMGARGGRTTWGRGDALRPHGATGHAGNVGARRPVGGRGRSRATDLSTGTARFDPGGQRPAAAECAWLRLVRAADPLR